MPVIKSAKKKLRQDKKRTLHNAKAEASLKLAVKAARKNPTDKTLRAATQAADKAAKRHIIHANKAARIKSSLAKLLAPKTEKKTAEKKEVKTVKKAAPKKSPAKKATK